MYLFPGRNVGTNLTKCQARKFAEDLSEYTAGTAQRALARNLWSFYIFLTVLKSRRAGCPGCSRLIVPESEKK